MPHFDKAFNRELFWIIRPYSKKPNTPAGQAALRLSRGAEYPGWRTDLDVVLAKIREINSFGFHTCCLRALSASYVIEDMLCDAERKPA